MTNSHPAPPESDEPSTESAVPDDSSEHPDSAATADGASTDRPRSESADRPVERVQHRARPTIRPQLAWIALTVLVGGGIAVALFANVLGLPDRQLAVIAAMAVAFVVVAVIGRLIAQIYVLTRTTYTITASSIRYEFSLWFRTRSREVPRSEVRAYQLERDRIQRLFGVGTVTVLTGGTNASLGYVEFSNVPDPETVRDAIRNG
ncbi:PH domain-containing protein [Natrinema versiforme]|uniref:YdbS-like PH domain-containing protein n=1 Tax=Natrinema versiforme JCM 10478 TaxID=1227496 RepID=L9XTU3_9EURY|nr:PH domain-containing protein [Natrinema versiforme]ELY65205.1 hypothetical protein C489_15532 [Natrinema versiforme JCM 10478]